MRRRLLLFIPALSQGGAERQILELGRRLTGAFDVTLCTLFQDEHYGAQADPAIRRIDLGYKTAGARQAFRGLVQVLRDERFDLVQSFMDQANLWVRLAALFAGEPRPRIVTSVRGPWMRLKYLALEGTLARYVGRAVVVNSRSTAAELRDWARVPTERLRVVHNFVDLETFRPATPAERQQARARFAIGPDEITLLLSGRLSPQKHHLGLALALRRLRLRGRLPSNVRLLLAGRARDAWYARMVDPALRWAGVAPLVRHLGVVPARDVAALYAATDVLLLPSLWEGLPNVALEAHACGVPAVVSDKANTDGVIGHGETGFEAPLTLGMRDYADALGQMLALSPEARQTMGARGHERVRRLFDPARVLDDWLGIYHAVLRDEPLPEALDPIAMTHAPGLLPPG